MGRGRGGRGGRGGGRGRGGGGRGGGGGGGQYKDDRVSFEKLPKNNEKLERYYNTLNIVPEGEEREKFWAALRRELPNSWRFTGSKGHALTVRNNMTERFFPILKEIEHDGKPVDLPEAMPWYPDGLAYSMTTPKNVVRKYGPFKEFQRFLVSETGVGNISRQEQVSMIPPLVLDVKPEHTVLDLCAAPGSKSAQLIELIHAGEEERVNKAIKNSKGAVTDAEGVAEHLMADGGRATGLLVANDVNYRRAQMLVHQVKRLNSPNLIVTNHDATMFPSIELPSDPNSSKNKYLKFDRILADVPCSGDGTCRKNPGIWKDWSPQNGLGLYITQVRILTRALQMLKVGGRVVYSTCSMNPIEDEAVVASAIERCGGVAKVKLVDSSDKLPGLIRTPGLTDWSIMARSGQIYESWPEAEQYEPENSKVVPGMFAPEAEEQIPLQNCMRVYPHQQDTGGFFIAVLEKISEIKAKPEDESKSQNKAWKFGETSKSSKPTDLSEILNDVETEPLDADGHLHNDKPTEGIDTNGENASPAQRQSQVPDEPSVGDKRKADDELEAADGEAAKKTKLDDPADTSSAPAPAPALQAPRPRRRDEEEAAVESFKYLEATHPALESVYKFYELEPSFPRDRFLVRNPAGDPVKGIYYTSQLAKDILIANEDRKMKFVHAGVKMFMKQDAQGQDICRWRIQTEGLPLIEGWVGPTRVIHMWRKSTLRKLLVEMFPKLSRDDVAGADDGHAAQSRAALGEIYEQVRDVGMGCCVVRVEARPAEADGLEEPLTLPLWRSLHSLNLMLPKDERKAMLLRIFDEDVELINHSAEARGFNATAAAAPESTPKGAETVADASADIAAAATAAAAAAPNQAETGEALPTESEGPKKEGDAANGST